MNTQEVANKLVEFCRQGQFVEAKNELYSNEIVSIEPQGFDPQQVQGIEAVTQKGEQFMNMFEVQSCEVSEPIVSENHFAITFNMNATNKQTGEATPMQEVAVYQVNNGKITQEQFFFNTQQS